MLPGLNFVHKGIGSWLNIHKVLNGDILHKQIHIGHLFLHILCSTGSESIFVVVVVLFFHFCFDFPSLIERMAVH